VPDHRIGPEKSGKLRSDLVERGRCLELCLADSGELGDLDGQAESRSTQALKGAFDDISSEADGSHLNDLIGAGLETGCFDVDCYEH
jgi:hypothetical protein